jgi:hypothetical protein
VLHHAAESRASRQALVPARGRRVTPWPLNNRLGWEDEGSSRAINAQPWGPMPRMEKRQCPNCRYFFAAPADAEEPRCPDCVAFGSRHPLAHPP